jgi:hypothetical protein
MNLLYFPESTLPLSSQHALLSPSYCSLNSPEGEALARAKRSKAHHKFLRQRIEMPLGCRWDVLGTWGQGSVDGKLQGKKTKFGKGLEDAEDVQETYDTWKESFGSCGYISETMVIYRV